MGPRLEHLKLPNSTCKQYMSCWNWLFTWKMGLPLSSYWLLYWLIGCSSWNMILEDLVSDDDKRSYLSWLLYQVDNDDYVRRVLKADDTKPPSKSESQHESSSRSKVQNSCSFSLRNCYWTVNFTPLSLVEPTSKTTTLRRQSFLSTQCFRASSQDMPISF